MCKLIEISHLCINREGLFLEQTNDPCAIVLAILWIELPRSHIKEGRQNKAMPWSFVQCNLYIVSLTFLHLYPCYECPTDLLRVFQNEALDSFMFFWTSLFPLQRFDYIRRFFELPRQLWVIGKVERDKACTVSFQPVEEVASIFR